MVIRYVPNKFETKEEWLPGGTKRIAEIDNSHSTALQRCCQDGCKSLLILRRLRVIASTIDD